MVRRPRGRMARLQHAATSPNRRRLWVALSFLLAHHPALRPRPVSLRVVHRPLNKAHTRLRHSKLGSRRPRRRVSLDTCRRHKEVRGLVPLLVQVLRNPWLLHRVLDRLPRPPRPRVRRLGRHHRNTHLVTAATSLTI